MFTVGTRLTHLTRAMRQRDPERALVAAGETVPDWSGGTRLGETLRIFLDRWGQRGMARGAVVVVFSDGWERGDPALLGRADAAAAPRRPPRRVGQPAPRQGGLRAGPAGRAGGRCRTSTTSSPATRWRLRRAHGGDRPCVRCSRAAGLVGDRRDGRRRHRRGDVPVRAPPARCLDAGRPRRVRGRLGVGRLRRGRGLRARPVGRRVRRAGPRRGTASPTTTPSPSASPAAASSTCSSRRSAETFPELAEIAADIEAGRPVALATVIEHPDPAVLGRRIVIRPGGGSP